VTRASRKRRAPELARGRLRILFFLLVLCAAAAGGQATAAVVAATGVALGVWSVSVANARGHSMAHTFATCDWLVLGLCLALDGGAGGWLVLTVPLLILAQLAPSQRASWPYLLVPVLPAVIIMAIADPTLGGNRGLGLAKTGGLVLVGVLLAGRLRRPAAPRPKVASVDPATGFYNRGRLAPMLGELLDDASADHVALSVVCVRLDHFADSRDFYGDEGAEAIVRGVAQRLKRAMGPDDLAFRARRDTFVVALRERSLREARTWSDDLRHEISSRLVAHHKQTVATGAAAFPPLRTPEDLLGEAFDGLRAPEAPALELAFAAAR